MNIDYRLISTKICNLAINNFARSLKIEDKEKFREFVNEWCVLYSKYQDIEHYCKYLELAKKHFNLDIHSL